MEFRPRFPVRPARPALPGDRRGTAAVELALVFPLLALFLFGLLVYGQYLFLAHGLQQLANDAARATIAGLNSRERTDLASDTARRQARAALGLDVGRLAVLVADADDHTRVTISYDASSSGLFRTHLLPMPGPLIRRTAAVRTGGL